MLKVLLKSPKSMSKALQDAVSYFKFNPKSSPFDNFAKSDFYSSKHTKNVSVWFERYTGFDRIQPSEGLLIKNVRNCKTGKWYQSYIDIRNNKASVFQVSEITGPMTRSGNVIAV